MTNEQKAAIIEAVARRYAELHKQYYVPYALLWDEMEEAMRGFRWNEAAMHIEAIGLEGLIRALETLREILPEFGGMNGRVWSLIDGALSAIPGYDKELHPEEDL